MSRPVLAPKGVICEMVIGDVMPKFASGVSLLKTPKYVPLLVAVAPLEFGSGWPTVTVLASPA